MTIGERIKKVRKTARLTQQDFSLHINVKRNTVALYEANKVTPSPAVISLICREFHVNEEWLREGTGEMFAEQDNSILAQLAERYALDGKAISLVESFLSLPAKHREIIVSAVENAARAMKKAAPAVTPEDMATYEKVKAQLAADPLSPEAPLSEEERELIQRMRLKKESNSRTAG